MTIARKLIMAASGTSVDPDTPDIYWQGSNWAWWDLSDFGSLWQDTARTTAVTAVGQSVQAVDDRSGNGNHMIYIAGTVPVLAQDGNGKFYLNFDGTTYFVAGGFPASSKNNLSLFGAFEKGTGGDGPAMGWGYSGITNEAGIDLQSNDNIVLNSYFTGTDLGVTFTDGAFDGTLFYVGVISEPDFTAYSSDTIAFLDSSQGGTVTDPSGTTYGSNINTYIGYFNGSNYWNGGKWYGSIVGQDIFTSNTDTAEVLDLVNGTNEYLAWLTGTSYSEISSIT